MTASRTKQVDERTPLLSEEQATDSRPTASSSSHTSPLDPHDIDRRFKRWVDHIKRLRSPSDVSPLERDPQFILSVFQSTDVDDEVLRHRVAPAWPNGEAYVGRMAFEEQLKSVKLSIIKGLHPKMIQTGSSGSYFVRAYTHVTATGAERSDQEEESEIVAVFKPHDEEPYGDFNPKRVLLRRYLWWAMGRPCLIPSFSFLSEVGASLLDDRLRLGIVPSTKLVSLASKSFFYPKSAREKDQYPEKEGSYQHFLRGYMNASTFLRAHPWPSRPRKLLEQDLQAENTAHGRAKARKRKGKAKEERKSRSRQCLSALSALNCLAPLGFSPANDSETMHSQHTTTTENADTTEFEWTKELMQDFRLELERLVCFDYLIRNTDRGLDNFMVKVHEPSTKHNAENRRRLTLCAIDNSLAFPWKHPAGIRSYPWGWLYLPTDLIGGPFSPGTRAAFISFLSSAAWWHQTQSELESLFRKDQHFDSKKFEGQMQVLRGQGWNLLESLRNEDEGPLELCARQKRLVERHTEIVTLDALSQRHDALLPLTPRAMMMKTKLLAAQEHRTQHADTAGASGNLTRAIALPVRSQGDRAHPVTLADSMLQPRSLPENGSAAEATGAQGNVSRWTQNTPGIHSTIDGIGHRILDESTTEAPSESQAKDINLGRAYRRGSLGIDVLTEIDKGTSRNRRPGLRKALTRGRSATRVAQSPPSKPQRLASFGGQTTEEQRREASRQRRTTVTQPTAEESTLEGQFTTSGDDMISSVASLDTNAYVNNSSSKQSDVKNRRRMGSVGDSWSIASALYQPRTGTPASAKDHADAILHASQKVKILSERLEIDDGIAWQTWLGLS